MSARILVVDDIEANVKLLEARLTAEYYEVLTASDGPTALALAASEKPDILARLTALAAAAHEPAREGTFADTTLHERDRRAKYGKHDDDSFIATPTGISKKGAKKGVKKP